ncbi:MAG: class I SAM-dependent methyltransferase [Candidatus Sphingomonas phytovorans]|nr:class I SAM-dependent methyltransferase [Sphingomonas sp.]WEK01484.1 MAG: class I SAM-dependent methyltransferase [Sphingomonas sp.]
MTDVFHPSVLDPTARTVVDRLQRKASKQLPTLFRHYLPRLPSMLLGRPVRPPRDIGFFDDKLLPLNLAQGDLLYLLARARRPRCAVEFGTSFGVSTIYLAAAIRDAGCGGRVIGTELVPAKAAAAQANLAAAGLANLVEIREGDARETLACVDEQVDFLLLDGWPQLALDVLRAVEPSLSNGAIVFVDNVAQFRTELKPVVERLSSPTWRTSMLPFRSGTLVAVRES